MTITDAIHYAVLKVPASAWTAAIEPDGEVCDGAWFTELDGDCLKGWPKGMRLTVRNERQHPGAQLRFTDADGLRLTCFVTNTTGILIASLELRHRQRARTEDHVRAARATGGGDVEAQDLAVAVGVHADRDQVGDIDDAGAPAGFWVSASTQTNA